MISWKQQESEEADSTGEAGNIKETETTVRCLRW